MMRFKWNYYEFRAVVTGNTAVNDMWNSINWLAVCRWLLFINERQQKRSLNISKAFIIALSVELRPQTNRNNNFKFLVQLSSCLHADKHLIDGGKKFPQRGRSEPVIKRKKLINFSIYFLFSDFQVIKFIFSFHCSEAFSFILQKSLDWK